MMIVYRLKVSSHQKTTQFDDEKVLNEGKYPSTDNITYDDKLSIKGYDQVDKVTTK